MEIHHLETMRRGVVLSSSRRIVSRDPAALKSKPLDPGLRISGVTAFLFFTLFALSNSVRGAVPDGYVVKADSTTVYLDWGKASGVQAGDQFKIYRAGEPLKHPVTGEVLGQTEIDLGGGAVDNVEDKFSIGKLMESKGDIKPGDRTRHVETAPVVQVSTAASAPAGPKELWRSDALPNEAIGLAIGDIEGSGKKEVVVAFRDHIEVFRWNGQKLESLAVFKGHGYGNYMTVETADLEGAGHDKIFASMFFQGIKRSRTVILELSNGQLKEVAHIEGYVRAIEHADGKRELIVQDLSLSREMRVRQPAPLIKKGSLFREGSPLKLARALNDDQLFGFTWGDWDADGSEDLAFLQNGERLRFFFKDAKWSSDERYGGTKADFSWDSDQVGSVYPRLLNLKTSAGKMQMLVPHNIQYTPIRLARLKIYRESELVDLAWNGLEMAPVWKLPIAGELADFGIGDAMQRGAPQLWIAAVGAGDKTLLIAYQIP